MLLTAGRAAINRYLLPDRRSWQQTRGGRIMGQTAGQTDGLPIVTRTLFSISAVVVAADDRATRREYVYLLTRLVNRADPSRTHSHELALVYRALHSTGHRAGQPALYRRATCRPPREYQLTSVRRSKPELRSSALSHWQHTVARVSRHVLK